MIDQSYTLLTRIPLYEGEGGFYADDLWEKDLSAHLSYIPDFRIGCPVEPISAASAPLKRIPELTAAQVIPLKADRGWGSVAANFLPNLVRVAGAVRRSEIVHTSCAGWAFPLAYYVWLLRPLMRFKWINVVESSFWVKPLSGPVSLRQRIEHHLHEYMVRRCVRGSDARIFTQDGYRDSYLGSHDAALVAPAVWIDDENVRSDEDLVRAQARTGRVRLVFPARLLPDKGVDTVLTAVGHWDARYGQEDGPPLELDIIGEGSLAERCRAFVAGRDPKQRLRMRFLDPVAYGAPFFDLLRGYDAAIVANRQAEQARIVYDVMAQGLPCIATSTVGNLAAIDNGETGAIFPIDEPEALAALMQRAATDREWLHALGRQALKTARGYSHSAMHRQREAFLRTALALAET